MKKTALQIVTVLIVAMASALAQSLPAPPTFIRGDMGIQFDSKLRPGKGVKDTYSLNINVNDSAIFHGTITHTPLIVENGMFSSSVVQARSLAYELKCDAINPANHADTRNVGRIFGTVPISENGVYRYADGNLTCSILSIGRAAGLDSKFGGVAMGKPTGKAVTGLQKAMMNIRKQVNGKTVSVSLTNYDKMIFQGHVLAAGPVQTYGEVTVGGEMVYDYDRYAWYFNNVTLQYAVGGQMKADRLTGDVRWVEASDRKTSGLGQYEFDIRVNEPPPGEAQAFAAPSDEAAYLSQDSSIPSLAGTMKYHDALSATGETLSSVVKIDLTGNQLTKQQAMALFKLLILSTVVPMNSD